LHNHWPAAKFDREIIIPEISSSARIIPEDISFIEGWALKMQAALP
jgi:hypothetical protein